jgi:hypothetical protein
MKKLLFFTIIGLLAVSCQPAELTCDCTGTGGGSGTVSGGGISLIDTNLIGHWKNTNPLVNLGNNNWSPTTDLNIYFSPDNKIYFNHTVNQNGFDFDQYSYMPYVIIQEGIMCLNNHQTIHYEINNGEFTYYAESGLDYYFSNIGNSQFYFSTANSTSSGYIVRANSLTKQ